MTPATSFVGYLVSLRWLQRWQYRALLFGTLVAACLILSVFPQRYSASTSLTPTDPESLGLSGTLGQLGAINNVFGNQAAVEVAMRVAKSVYVRDTVIGELKLRERLDEKSAIKLHRMLEANVDVRSLRGGIITISMSNRDPTLARDIVGAYGRAVQLRLAEVSRRRTAYKRGVLIKLVEDASQGLVAAQNAYDGFRLHNRYSDPRASITAIGSRVPALEAAIKSKQVAIYAARQIYAENNVRLSQLNAELTALQGQLAQARATSLQGDEGVGRLVNQTSQLFKLERDLAVAKALYDSYMRYLQGTAVEDMTSSANVRVLEQPYVDTGRQYYLPALAGAAAFFLLWMAIEFYRLRPPVGTRLPLREQHGQA